MTDDLLQLIFLTCHPALTRESQVALTLRLFGGLSSAEIARAFLVPEATVAQRISRAKRTLRDASAELELPAPDQLPARVAAVGEVVYLIFNEGYAATAGADWTRPDLCAEAIRLGRILTSLLPEESELHGLSALMQLHASRLPARIDAAGRPVLLADQDRRRWDRLLIRQGVAALDRAIALGGALRPYALQASIAACHAARPATARRTGPGSRRSTRCWPTWRRRRSSSSTGPSPSAGPTVPRRGWPSSTRSPRPVTWRATRSCRPSGPTCWSARADRPRRPTRTGGLPSSPTTRASARSSSTRAAALEID